VAVITLLTDFGTADGYVAAMKGAIREIAPDVFLDDAAHDIPAGDVPAAAWALGAYWDRYPQGTVHLIVVDPGVGSARRAVAADVRGRRFVCPDNGILTRVIASCARDEIAVVEIDPPRDAISSTFHGRDLFAPVAARLAAGAALDTIGRGCNDVVLLTLPQPSRDNGMARGEVIHVDRYGNLITNIPAAWVTAGARARIGGRELPCARTYSDVAPGLPLAVIGSRSMLEISVRDGSAAELLQADRGSEVEVVQGTTAAEANASPLR
jgi:S-adenosylmethionine hydrolase